MKKRKEIFSNIEQLKKLIERYPEDNLEIEGIIIDYIGQSRSTLDQVFELNQKIYFDFFTGDNLENGKRLLYAIIDSDLTAKTLISNCHSKYDKIEPLLNEIKTENQTKDNTIDQLVKDPDKYLNYDISSIIWQLSDIHFGRYNKLENDPVQLAYMLSKIVVEYPKLRPHIIIVSGDITSISHKMEYNKFVTFCDRIGVLLWGKKTPERILVVPGNHDINWLKNGKSDKMSKFIEIFSISSCCITPFGKKKQTFNNNKIQIKRYALQSNSAPPIAEIIYNEYNLRVILLISSYFSGIVPDKVRAILRTKNINQDLVNILRVDEGSINREYIHNFAQSISIRKDLTTIAVIHHNQVPIGQEVCLNKFAPELLETLWTHNVPLLFHGHVHQYEDLNEERPPQMGRCYPIPCTTLCSIPSSGQRGFNIIFMDKSSKQRKIDTFIWNESSLSTYNPNGLVPRYRISLGENKISVIHGYI